MNKQGTKDNPLGGIEWTHILGPMTGYTANPVRGCEHECRWRMPDGNIAVCYAESFSERMNGPGSFKKITFHRDVLDDIRSHKKPAGIFIDSMSDLFGESVENHHICQVIDTIRACPQHVFFTLTKNPRRLTEFAFPDNCLVGMSAPPTFMYGKELTPEAQQIWFRKGIEWLSQCQAKNIWLSMEPLSLDLSDTINTHRERICFAVIGAASNGSALYQPDEKILTKTLTSLAGVPVFFKGNLSKELADRVAGGWRAEFPTL